MTDDWGFATRQIHSGAEARPDHRVPRHPIYQTTAYQFRDTEHAANLFPSRRSATSTPGS